MDKTLFERSPIGDLLPISGTHAGEEFEHFAFLPNRLPSDLELPSSTWNLIGEAMHALGKLDSAGKRVPNPRLLARPAIRREAVSTSALEGTYTTLPQILESEATEDEGDSKDVDEVLRYVRTAELAYQTVDERPLSPSFVRELHGRLMMGDARCPEDQRGAYRTRQNFIGPRSAGIVDSFFVPPPPGDAVTDAMEDWFRWIADENVAIGLRLAVGHYQFEAIHPFFDGNGRLGRLLLVLQLMKSGKLTVPILEISTYLEQRRDEYQQHLRQVSITGDFDPWVAFFMEGIRIQSERGLTKVDSLLDLREEMLHRLRDAKVRGTAMALADELIGAPVVTPSRVAARYGVTYPAALSAIRKLETLGLLRRIRPEGRRHLYSADQVIEILEK